MAHGTFIWADQAALNTGTAEAFYQNLFGWTFSDGQAVSKNGPVASIWSMPEFFRGINMPAFWMSVIEVSDVDRAIETANEMGGKVEMGPEDSPLGGRFALIRDPLGAGFTVMENPPTAGASKGHGGRLAHGLFVSDASVVTEFYSKLFDWEFKPHEMGVLKISTRQATVGYLHEIADEAVRGKEQYWAIFFGHESLENAANTIEEHGGAAIAEFDIPEGKALAAQDQDGAGLFLLEVRPANAQQTSESTGTKFPVLGWFGFALMAGLVFTEETWIWAIFLGTWVFTGLRDKETWLFERIGRDEHSILYWALMLSYSALALLAVVS